VLKEVKRENMSEEKKIEKKKMTANEFYDAVLTELQVSNQLLNRVIGSVEKVRDAENVVSAKFDDFNETMRTFLEYLKEAASKPVETIQPLQPERTSQLERRKPALNATPWRPSNNPKIQWCPEQEADPKDVQRAKDKQVGMWYLPPKGEFQHGSIFKKS